MTELESIRIRATLDALVRAANALTTDERFEHSQEAQRRWEGEDALHLVCKHCGDDDFVPQGYTP